MTAALSLVGVVVVGLGVLRPLGWLLDHRRHRP